MRASLLVLAVLLAFIAGCPSPTPTLSVDVITDLTAGPEFDLVDITLFAAGASRSSSGEVLRTTIRPTSNADAARFARGLRVADFGGVVDGPYTLRVRLLRPPHGTGTVLAEKWSSIVVRGSSRVSIGLDAACVAVTCPAPGGSPAFTECARGQCVDTFCNPEDATTWADHCCDPNDPNANCGRVVFCSSASDCDVGTSTCAEPACERGLCLNVEREGACPEQTYCARESGCLPLPTENVACVDMDRDRWCATEDCDDMNRSTFEGAAELCDGADNDCDTRIDEGVVALPWYLDEDGDGYGSPSDIVRSCAEVEGRTLALGDCAPMDGTRYPGATERCDGRDSDCFDNIEDIDGDGHASIDAVCEGGFPKDDCAPNDASVFPLAPELCDDIDNDCDGTVDEDVESIPVYADMDRDGYTGTTVIGMSCAPAPSTPGDCNDDDRTVSPGAREDCDLIDNDCNGRVDDLAPRVSRLALGVCHRGEALERCLGGAWVADFASLPGWEAVETRCDELDNDCDGLVDEGVERVTLYIDNDGDGYGAWDDFSIVQATTTGCPGAPGTATLGHDLNDSNPLSNPGVAEVCNGIDDNADGEIDGAGLCAPGTVCSNGSCLPCTPVGPTVGGVIGSSAVWCPSAGTLTVTSDLLIVPGVTLTIAGGTRLVFGAGLGITNRGTLETAATPALPVTFTSIPTTRGFWRGIESSDRDGIAHLQGIVVENASTGVVLWNNGLNYVASSTIRNAVVGVQETSIGSRNLWLENCDVPFYGAGLYRARVVHNQGPSRVYYVFESTYADNAVPLGAPVIYHSNLCRNGMYEARLENTANISIPENYWCTTSESEIRARIYDFEDDPRLGRISYAPFLTEAWPTAPALP